MCFFSAEEIDCFPNRFEEPEHFICGTLVLFLVCFEFLVGEGLAVLFLLNQFFPVVLHFLSVLSG